MNSLSRSSQFKELYNRGRKRVSRYFVLFFLSDEEFSLGVVASKKSIGKTAVSRNRAKRLLREAFRAALAQADCPLKPGRYVLVARRDILSAKMQNVLQELLRC